jgi:exodeoxyribonuclease V beta subunit
MLEAPEARLDAWLEAVERWREVANRGGVLPLVRAIVAEHHTAGRWLNAPDGERRLTNLLHLSELLHAEASERRLGLGSVVEALAAHRADARVTEDAELRLESDAQAVQIVTVHKSKGLEYKYVLCPFLSARSRPDTTRNLVFRDGDGCVLDLQLDPTDAESALRAAQMEQAVAWEGARLLYVALTRARHQVHLWCAPALNAASALQAMLLGRQAPSDPYSAAPVDASEANLTLMARLEALEAEPGLPEGGLRVVPIHDEEAPAPPPVPADDPPRARPLGHRDFDTQWRRASFTSLVRGAHAPPEAGSPEDRGAERDDRVGGGEEPGPEPLPEERPLSALARGAETGVFLHALLERADFARAREEGHLEAIATLEAERAGLAWPAETEKRVLDGLRVALDTPLGPALDGRCLREIRASDRLNELDFELPVWGGWDASRGHAMRAAGLAEALGVGPDAPPASWREQIARLGAAPLRGFLTGSIDLVFRSSVAGRTRWFLVDWKSNDLARGVRQEQAWTAAKVHSAMVEHHYFLQYHLYAVALRRFLRSRLGPDFEWDRDFGGVLYIFLRGLDRPGGPLSRDGTPVPVFTDRPPASRLDAIDAVLGGGAP